MAPDAISSGPVDASATSPASDSERTASARTMVPAPWILIPSSHIMTADMANGRTNDMRRAEADE